MKNTKGERKAMNKYRKILNVLLAIVVLFCISVAAQNINVDASSDGTIVQKTFNVKVFRHTETSLKIKWKSVQKADGYIVYRYNKTSKKYKAVHTVSGNKTAQWTNKKLKTNQVYKYKVSAYKNVNGKKVEGKASDWAKAKTYRQNGKKINGQAPKVSRKKVYLGLCSSKKITARVTASKYGTNKKKKAFSKKVRWSSSNKEIAKVSKQGVITAGTKAGSCYVYAKAHNGRKTKILVTVKNYARAKSYYNYGEESDIYALITDYKTPIQDIAEYFSMHRPADKETIYITLNDETEMVVKPQNADLGNLKQTIESLLVDFPYYIEIKVVSDGVDFILHQQDSDKSPVGYVSFLFDNDCSEWDTQIAPHWEAWRSYPI
ncbi:MAG: hypothetical protein ACLRZ9_10975 [Eubacterium sp.]